MKYIAVGPPQALSCTLNRTGGTRFQAVVGMGSKSSCYSFSRSRLLEESFHAIDVFFVVYLVHRLTGSLNQSSRSEALIHSFGHGARTIFFMQVCVATTCSSKCWTSRDSRTATRRINPSRWQRPRAQSRVINNGRLHSGTMAFVYIPVQNSSEEVRVALDQLPRDATDILDILKAEQAPLNLWLTFAVLKPSIPSFNPNMRRVFNVFKLLKQWTSYQESLGLLAIVSVVLSAVVEVRSRVAIWHKFTVLVKPESKSVCMFCRCYFECYQMPIL